MNGTNKKSPHMKFKSTFRVSPAIYLTKKDIPHIKNETMLFSADYNFARKNGDILTQKFLDAMPPDWKESNLIIDSRVHMLMPGWCPCIPGWHHDDIPRTRIDGQPNYDTPEYYSEHLLMVLNAEVAPTEFLTAQSLEIDIPPIGSIVYEGMNRQINERVLPKRRLTAVHKVEGGVLYRFDWQTFHRGVPAVKDGWRFFIRASRYWQDKKMTMPDNIRPQRRTPKNEIRRQVQVYLSSFEKGW